MNKMFDNKFFYRLRFFVLGILLGTIVLWVIYWKDNRSKVYKWPSEIIKENIRIHPWNISPNIVCKLACVGVDTSLIRKKLSEFDIDYSKSKVSEKPCKKYFFNANLKDNNLHLIFSICSDTVIVLDDISTSISCNCP